MRQEWPLVGRSAELDFAKRTLATPSLSGLVLAGRAGVGRTRLLREILAAGTMVGSAGSASGEGHAIEVRATAPGIPFGAIAHLLPDLDRGPEDAATLRICAAALLAHAGGKRLLLGIDDATQLDPATATLVAHLCHTRQAFAVLTVQVGVAVPAAVFGLWKDGLAERLDLAELDRPASDELVAALLGGPVEGAVLQQLWELAQGTPLFLRELVAAGTRAGTLTCEDGVWRCVAPLEPGPRLLELVESRIGTLTEDEDTLLELLAHGAPLGAEILLGMGAERVLGRTERRGLVVSALSGKRLDVDLVHPLIAEVIRRRTTPLRARRTHRILVQAIEGTGARRATDGPRLVGWRLASGSPVDAAAVLAAAEGTPDLRIAERLARAAVAAEGGPRARILLADLLLATGRAAEAEGVLLPVAEEAGPQLALARASARQWLGLPPDATGAVRGALLLAAGRCTDALAELAELEPTAEVLAVRALAECAAARYEDALATAERGLALDPGWWTPALQSAQLGAHALAGRLAVAEALAATGYADALARHWPVASAVHAGWLGRIALLRGRVRTARRWLREAAAVPTPPFPPLAGVREELAIAMGLTGDGAAAEALLSGVDTLDSPTPWPLVAQAWLAAVRGETSLAGRLVAEATGLARAGGARYAELVALHAGVRLGVEVPAGELADLQGELAAVQLAHLAATDGEALDAVAERFGALGVPLLAAEAAAQAVLVYETAGRTGSRQASAKRATAWARECEEVRTPALLALKAPTELTRRELEIARLAAGGMSSKAIAARLVVSVRTVDNVLHSVYAKLGVKGRAELAGAVG
jgi:DNA-binding CsgD family transcriptional regulator